MTYKLKIKFIKILEITRYFTMHVHRGIINMHQT